LITFLPLVFLSVTVLWADALNIGMYMKFNNTLGNINTTVSVMLLVLVIITLLDSIRVWLQLLKTEKPLGMNTEIKNFCDYNNTKPNINV
jgi:carbon starvation protein